MAARFVRDEEVVGSNPATPTAETADQERPHVRTLLICFVCVSNCVTIDPECVLSDYGYCGAAPKMPSMTTAPVWITGRICLR